jgi:hypothetical protein
MPKNRKSDADKIRSKIDKKLREIQELRDKLSLIEEERIKHMSPKFKEMFGVGEEKKEGQ